MLVTVLSLPAVVPVTYAQGNSQTQASKLSQAQLEALVAPIALYPDSLVSQILMASTYPLEVSEATNWLRANSNLKGDTLNNALQQQNWDASVKSLVSFPPVLEMMGSQLSWTQNLGNAVLAQQSDTMAAIQALRAKAKKSGSLQSNAQQTVTTQGGGSSETIIIQPTNPQVVYVPSYNPTVVYGAWPYPAYPPAAYYPPGYVAGTALLSFGIGMAVGAALWGGCHWGGYGGGNSLTVNNNTYNNFNRNTNNNWNGNKNGTSNWKPDQQRRNANVGGGGANRNAERDQLRQNLQKNGINSDDRGNLGNHDGDRSVKNNGDRNYGQNDRSSDRAPMNRDSSPSNFRSDSSGFGDARGAKFNGGSDRFGSGGARAGGEHFGGGFRGRR
jgi:hypothetical protein